MKRIMQDVRVPLSNMLLGEGRGFEIAQGRLGPGRLHHCMRLIGMGERAMELMGRRALARIAFKKPIAQHGSFAADFARCRVELSAARLTVLDAADSLDRYGNKRVGLPPWISACFLVPPACSFDSDFWVNQMRGSLTTGRGS